MQKEPSQLDKKLKNYRNDKQKLKKNVRING